MSRDRRRAGGKRFTIAAQKFDEPAAPSPRRRSERENGMAFWLRAGLVIGAIYYLSPLRLGEAPAPAQTAQAGPALGEVAGPLLDAVPSEMRARVVEVAAAEAGRTLATGLRAAVVEAARSPSRDTLTPHDRQPAWRGAAEREAH